MLASVALLSPLWRQPFYVLLARESAQSVQHDHYFQHRILRGSVGKDRGTSEGATEYDDAASAAAAVEKQCAE
jgi:hypothetical protein